jgi:phospholipase C
MGEGPAITSARRRPKSRARYYAAIAAATVTGAGLAVGATIGSASAAPLVAHSASVQATGPATGSLILGPRTATPIRHLVVIFQENVSFDHYFGTYPNALNLPGENPFHAKANTPAVNGLTPALLTNNPNGANPVRLTPAEALTCDQDHAYTPEQKAFDNGQMDMFPENTEGSGCSLPDEVMDYYDGNTVTGLWNYAQNYAMSDNNYDTDFGPSTPGALNVISGYDGSAYAVSPSATDPLTAAHVAASSVGYVGGNTANLGTIFGDMDPAFDGCSDSSHTTTNAVGVATGENIGDLLNAKNITWGWFQGGFAPTGTSNGYPVCGATHTNIGGNVIADYSPHHEPFQYYGSTSNPDHLPPSSEAMIGRTDQANHQYDLSYFYEALQDGNLPSVSYLKAAEYQDGHAGYSDPIDEQNFLVNTVNQIEESRYWPSTAIVITYDDSDGWYDHQASPIVNGSNTSADTAMCSDVAITLGTYGYRCGYGPRLPLIVISPWTRSNYVSHNVTDQSSIVRFIEDNWLGGERIGNGSYDAIAGSLYAPGGVLDFHTFPNFFPVILDPTTGEVVNNFPF